MIDYAWLVPFLPLLGALVVAVGGRWLKGQSHLPIVAGIGLAFLVSLGLLFRVGDGTGHVRLYEWIDAGDLHVPVEFRVDGLTTMMLSMVTFVATLVAVFAAGYMHGDPGYPRFFSIVGLFVFSMTGLVLSNNYVLTYAFWEGVGVCSYLLVGFWHAKPAAAAAAQKAFLVNRVGDFGFAVAIFWLWTISPGHSLSYDVILDPATIANWSGDAKLWIALLLFWAATAKSAQIPLYVWLPDAMEGPTPVSALIHAATMVTAGVYLVARSSLLIFDGPIPPLVIAIIGCSTALLSASIALTQTDLKRVMAYSTVSQLGYMFMALGSGVGGAMRLAVVAAMFHLFTHAFFKALLFLSSGSVMHAMGGVIDMRRFRGLRHRLPITHLCFLMGGLALAGIVPFAGFWSKDEILSALKLASHESHGASATRASVYMIIYYVAVLTAFMTAFYTGRAYFLTFWGPEKLPSPDDPEAEADESHGHGHAHGVVTPELPSHKDAATDEPVGGHGQGDAHGHGGGHDAHFGHESPPIMWIPLAVLAVCAVGVGMVFGPTGWFEHHLSHTPNFERLGHVEEHGLDWLSIGLGTLAGLLGIGLAWVMYAAPSALPGRIAGAVRPLYEASYKKFKVDEAYEAVVILPTRALAIVCKYVDIYFIDGLVRLTAWVPRFVGRDVLAKAQNGLVQHYAAITAVGLTAVLLYVLMTGPL